jgi:hypothetical protein
MALEVIFDLLLSKSVVTVLAIPVLLFFIARTLEPHVDKLEPATIKPRIPFIGHFIEQSENSQRS